jgi:hypothetical protein
MFVDFVETFLLSIDHKTILFKNRDLALFLYSGGYSPGLFALSVVQKLPAALVEVGDLEIIISRNQPRIIALVDLKFLGGQGNPKFR